ncbi:MAG: multiheme c-type cytochrome [Pseudomonadota bacterium]
MLRTFLSVIISGLMLVSSALAQQEEPANYVGSATCATCHAAATEAWAGSHHALAWTVPSSETIIADFDNTRFEHDGAVHEFSNEDGAWLVTITYPDGTKTEYPVHSVVGIEPLQQYLLEIEEGRLQSYDVTWDVLEERWYHLYPDQRLPPDDGLHWSGPYKNWNGRCAECHATGFTKNYNPLTRTYASTQSEIGVGCEACHGPGSRHLEWAEKNATSPVTPPEGYGFSMDFAAAGTEAMIQQCAGCHSRREAIGDGNPLPGTSYHDSYTLALLRPGLYHADGQILDEVYVYGSFLQSKMYEKGVGCLDCHDAHTAELKADGNGICTQCHSPAGNPEFPTLTLKNYDDPEHHFHPVGSEGAQCSSCHMIERTYMGIDGRRDHSFRIPRPDLAPITGSPDACTDCHTDQTPAWAAAEIAKRYPDSSAREHYGVTLAAGRANPATAREELSALALDESEPAIARATALWLLSQGADGATADKVAPLLQDEEPLVRAAAISVQNAIPPQFRVQRTLEMLDDPVRMVRIEAAKSMLNAPIARLPGQMQEKMERAMDEWRGSLAARFDFPETHMVLGGMALTMRNIEGAKGAFREAVRMDPQNEDAWVMLTRIAAAVEGRDATVDVLDEALQILPDSQVLNEMKGQIPAN